MVGMHVWAPLKLISRGGILRKFGVQSCGCRLCPWLGVTSSLDIIHIYIHMYILGMRSV